VYQSLDVAIKAAHKIAHQIPHLKLFLFGTGTEEQRLRELARSLGATNVIFGGRRPYAEMPAISALSDVMLIHLSDLPLLRWTIPSKTQIALAMGIPILMAAKGDTAKLVRASNSGVICEPDDPDAMARAMLEIASLTEEQRNRLGP
jgi:glycosyltransferase involved in cell wall biosynthesis